MGLSREKGKETPESQNPGHWIWRPLYLDKRGYAPCPSAPASITVQRWRC